jgi:trk system potassium uptake protein TrkA
MEIAGVPQGVRQRVMIIGGGRVGSRVAELLRKSVEIILVEVDEVRARELAGNLSHVEVLHGDGSKADVLNMAGVQEIDTFISATGSNEANIMSSLLAKNLMKAGNGDESGIGEKTIAVVSNEDYQVLAATIGIDIALNKKIMAASEIMKEIRRSELISVAHLHGFDAEVVELIAAPNSPITKKPLSKIGSRYQGQLLIGSIYRDGDWRVAVGNTHIADNDRAIGVCLSRHLKDMRKLFSV